MNSIPVTMAKHIRRASPDEINEISEYAGSLKIKIQPGQFNMRIIHISPFETPIGTMIACAVEEGICLLEFADRKMLKTELQIIAKHFNARIMKGKNMFFDMLDLQLREYFSGSRKEFSVPTIAPGTDFQEKVWKELIKIPYGQTRSYKQQALALNNPGAIRAVAHANGMNRISIIIPCHRVVGDDGELTGYGGGLWRKKYLLELESGSYRLKL